MVRICTIRSYRQRFTIRTVQWSLRRVGGYQSHQRGMLARGKSQKTLNCTIRPLKIIHIGCSIIRATQVKYISLLSPLVKSKLNFMCSSTCQEHIKDRLEIQHPDSRHAQLHLCIFVLSWLSPLTDTPIIILLIPSNIFNIGALGKSLDLDSKHKSTLTAARAVEVIIMCQRLGSLRYSTSNYANAKCNVTS